MKITTWNIKHGGQSRITSILEILKIISDNDILVLTEFRNNENGQKIKLALDQLNFKFVISHEIDPNKNTVLIASKDFFEAFTFQELREHSQRVIKIENDNLTIYGCYFPQKDEKKPVFEFLLNQISLNKGKSIIITGDINTGKHNLDEIGESFYQPAYLDRFEESGMIDAWRLLHNDKREYSWYSNSKNGFRIDHFFIHSDLKDKVKDCYYIHKYREEKSSDHSMMTLELE